MEFLINSSTEHFYEFESTISQRSRIYLFKKKVLNIDKKILNSFPEKVVQKQFYNDFNYQIELDILKMLVSKKKGKFQNDPNLRIKTVKLFGFIDNEKCIYMKYYEKGSLKDLINKKEIIYQKQILSLFQKICVTVNNIHLNNIVHRDIKPDNIFISAKFTPVLGDFGSAKVFKPSDLNLAGTQVYMSPELLRVYKDCNNNKNFNIIPINYKREDMFCLGKTFYEVSVKRVYINFIEFNIEDIKIEVSKNMIQINSDRKFLRLINEMLEEPEYLIYDICNITYLIGALLNEDHKIVLKDEVKCNNEKSSNEKAVNLASGCISNSDCKIYFNESIFNQFKKKSIDTKTADVSKQELKINVSESNERELDNLKEEEKKNFIVFGIDEEFTNEKPDDGYERTKENNLIGEDSIDLPGEKYKEELDGKIEEKKSINLYDQKDKEELGEKKMPMGLPKYRNRCFICTIDQAEVRLKCKHYFHKNCLNNRIKHQLRNFNLRDDIICVKCFKPIEYAFFKSLELEIENELENKWKSL